MKDEQADAVSSKKFRRLCHVCQVTYGEASSRDGLYVCQRCSHTTDTERAKVMHRKDLERAWVEALVVNDRLKRELETERKLRAGAWKAANGLADENQATSADLVTTITRLETEVKELKADREFRVALDDAGCHTSGNATYSTVEEADAERREEWDPSAHIESRYTGPWIRDRGLLGERGTPPPRGAPDEPGAVENVARLEAQVAALKDVLNAARLYGWASVKKAQWDKAHGLLGKESS